MPFFSESQALGTGSSPWTVNGNDLYPDSLSYLVGIGTTNPDTLLHIKAADGTPKIKLEGTDYDYTIEVDANPGGSQNSSLLRFESDTHFASNQIEFTNGSAHSGSGTELYITANAAGAIIFKDKDGANDKVALSANYTTERFQMYGDDGYAGGMFAMDWKPANDARFAFGYGNEELSNAARLAIKHTSNPQLLLDDGTSTATFQHEDNSSSPRVTLNQALRLTHATNAHLTLDDLEASNNNPVTIRKYKDVSTHTVLFQSENGAASGNSTLDFVFKNDRTGGGGTVIRAIGGSSSGLYLTDGAQGLKIDQITADRRVRYRDFAGGNAAGCFNMEYNDSGSGTAQNYFSFGYGDEAHPYDARLNIKDAALPQLALTDGTETTTIETGTDALVVHQDSNWDFKIDANAGANANLRFSEAGVSKAGLIHLGATESGLVQRSGFFRDSITAASGATVAINATTTGNVIACDTTSNAITATLPAVANYTGATVYIIDSKGNAGATSPSRAITIAVQTGEYLDGVINGTATISSNHGFSTLVCTADGWFQVS